jgi:hypothetical protein
MRVQDFDRHAVASGWITGPAALVEFLKKGMPFNLIPETEGMEYAGLFDTQTPDHVTIDLRRRLAGMDTRVLTFHSATNWMCRSHAPCFGILLQVHRAFGTMMGEFTEERPSLFPEYMEQGLPSVSTSPPWLDSRIDDRIFSRIRSGKPFLASSAWAAIYFCLFCLFRGYGTVCPGYLCAAHLAWHLKYALPARVFCFPSEEADFSRYVELFVYAIYRPYMHFLQWGGNYSHAAAPTEIFTVPLIPNQRNLMPPSRTSTLEFPEHREREEINRAMRFSDQAEPQLQPMAPDSPFARLSSVLAPMVPAEPVGASSSSSSTKHSAREDIFRDQRRFVEQSANPKRSSFYSSGSEGGSGQAAFLAFSREVKDWVSTSTPHPDSPSVSSSFTRSSSSSSDSSSTTSSTPSPNLSGGASVKMPFRKNMPDAIPPPAHPSTSAPMSSMDPIYSTVTDTYTGAGSQHGEEADGMFKMERTVESMVEEIMRFGVMFRLLPKRFRFPYVSKAMAFLFTLFQVCGGCARVVFALMRTKCHWPGCGTMLCPWCNEGCSHCGRHINIGSPVLRAGPYSSYLCSRAQRDLEKTMFPGSASMDLLPTLPGDPRLAVDPYDELRRILSQMLAESRGNPFGANTQFERQEHRFLEFLWSIGNEPPTFGILLPVSTLYISCFLFFS